MTTSENSGQTDAPTKVRIFKPKALVLGFHGTIAPIDWEDKCILPYIQRHLREYLIENRNNSTLIQLIPRLRQESFDQHFVYEMSECPVIGDDDDEPRLILSLNDFLIWQMNNFRETKDSKRVFRLVWMDGLNKHRIRVPLFEDVVPALKLFKEEYHIKIAIYSSVDQQLCRQFFANTTEGDINQYFDHYFDFTIGGSKDKESFQKMAKELDVQTKDILYVIDYGQSAKCAKELGFQCLLIIRPFNRKIRDYYFLRFNKINSLLDIEFVERQSNV